MNKHLPGRHNQKTHGHASSLDDDVAALVKDHHMPPTPAKIVAGQWHRMGHSDLSGFLTEVGKLPGVKYADVRFDTPSGIVIILTDRNSNFTFSTYESSSTVMGVMGRKNSLLRKLPPKDANKFLSRFEKACLAQGIKQIHSTVRTIPVILAANRGYEVGRNVGSFLLDELAYKYLNEKYNLPGAKVAVGEMSIKIGMPLTQVLNIPHRLFPEVSLFTEYLNQLDPDSDYYVAIDKELT